MGIGTSLVLIAIGAILRFAITVSSTAHGFNIHTIGVILMIVGVIGLVISLLWLFTLRNRRPAGSRYAERDVPPPADTY